MPRRSRGGYSAAASRMVQHHLLPTERANGASRQGKHVARVGRCPLCKNLYNDLRKHTQDDHKDHHWTDAELAPLNMIACECGQACSSESGLRTHSRGNVHARRVADIAAKRIEDDGEPFVPELDAENTAAVNLTVEEKVEQLFLMPAMTQPLGIRWHDKLKEAMEELCNRFLTSPSEENLLAILALPKATLVPNQHPSRAHKLDARLRNCLTASWLAAPESRMGQGRTRTKSERIVRAVEQGNITRASRILCNDSRLAEPTAENLEAAAQLYPRGPLCPFGPNVGPDNRLTVPFASLKKALKTFDPSTSPGWSGWDFALTKLLLVEETAFANFLITLGNMILRGTAPGHQMLTAASLMLSEKPAGGLRPIAVPEFFYRLIGKAILEVAFKADSLLPTQLGVGTPGGVETIVRCIERAIADDMPYPYDCVEQPDLKNAFNTIDRKQMAAQILKYAPHIYKTAKWVYDKPTKLFTKGPDGMHVQMSTQGVNQGEVLYLSC